MNISFTAIDFETAVGARNSICQVGIAIVENGKIVKTISKLVQPPENKYSHWNIRVHGITPDMTEDTPFFSEVWNDIKPYIEDRQTVAHNAAFDTDCIYKTLNYYNIPVPNFSSVCTYQLTRQKLNIACQAYKIDLSSHHDAECDAVACAKLYLKILNNETPDYSIVKEKPKGKHTRLSGDILKQDLSNADPNNPFYDKKIVITGLFDTLDRIEIAEKLKKRGAKINTSISRRTDYLIKGRNAGYMKLIKVKELQANGSPILVIEERELLEVIR